MIEAVAAEVEPAADGHTHEHCCLNCGTLLAGDYCHACGQHAHVHRTIGAFFHDLAHGVFHFEGKIANTLPLLAWKPGDLTRRYIEGQRTRFVSPIALFLFSVFLMFAAVSFTGELQIGPSMPRDLAQAEQEASAELGRLRSERVAATGASAEVLDAKIVEAQRGLEVIRSIRTEGVAGTVLANRQAGLDVDLPWLRDAAARARQNPQLLYYKLKTNAYKWSWALIPLSVPFLWLLFPFSRRFQLYDHVVFVTYSLSFMSLLVAVTSLLSALELDAAALPLVLVPPVHIYRQLRGAYALERGAALWRTAVLVAVALAVLLFFVIAMAALGALD